jgi:membrane-associated PAP2 superfamily phosphatase
MKLWWTYARTPLTLFVVLAVALAMTDLDVVIARSLFFDAVHGRWIAADHSWVNQILHTGGRWAIRAIVLVAIALWIAASLDRNLRALRRPAAFFIVSVVLSVAIVGSLKTLTNVDCPWDLTPFGGRYPLVHLFDDRPDALRYGRCFPAAHASSGYALFALYFVFRERSSAAANAGLILGIGTGLVFGLAQQARGAHFASHDLWSAFVAWIVALTLYASVFNASLWKRPVTSREPEPGALEYEAALSAPPLVVGRHVDVELRTRGLRRPASG